MLRQKTVIFSSFILPLIIIWSTWWVTADIPMDFKLFNVSDKLKNVSMIDVHVVTGGLTAMSITAGLFAFILTAENQKINTRLKLMGYTNSNINLGSLISILVVIFFTSLVTIIFSVLLADSKDWIGIAIAIFLITLTYTAFGNFIGTIYPKVTEGTLLILIFAFSDLMMITNPMGQGIYLQTWTYFLPGFWPVQIALESGFVGFPNDMIKLIGYSLSYFLAIILINQFTKTDLFVGFILKLRGKN